MPTSFEMRLIMQRGPAPGQLFEFEGEVVTIGRDASNDLAAADAEVSRHHARLVREGQDYLLEDLGSTNGTFLNGRRLTSPQVVRGGDRISLGETVEFAVEMAGQGAEATLAAGLAQEPEIAGAPAGVEETHTPEMAEEIPPDLPLSSVRAAQSASRAAEREPRPSYRNYFLAGCGCLALLAVLGLGAYWLLYLAPCEFYLALGMVGNCLPVP